MVAAHRSHSFVFPMVLIVGGAVLLLAEAGAISSDAGWRLLDLWPLILIAIGVQLVAWRLFKEPLAGIVALGSIALIAIGAFAYAIGGPLPAGAGTSHVTASAPMDGISAGRVTIDAAGSQVTINAADTGDQLYQARADYSGSTPTFSYTAGSLHISTGHVTGFNWSRSSDNYVVTVNSAMPWTVVINGAGVTASLDFSRARLQTLSVNGVGSKVTLAAGMPSGTVPITLAGVGINATITVPPETQYRAIATGIGTSVDGNSQTSGWVSANDRYDVSASGVGAKVSIQEAAS